MATSTRGPKPWTQHRASTIFLRVPSAEWTAVRHGIKREFRAESGKVSQWPLHMTTVFRVRRWNSEDERAMADALLERLYGEFLAADNSRSYPSTGPPPCAVGT